MKIGYARVSTLEQNTARQEVLMEQLGVDKVFIEKANGRDKKRPELERMLNFVREGDTVVVESLSRFSRGTLDFLQLYGQLKEKGVNFISHKENWDTSTPQGEFMITVFAALAQLEVDTTKERQMEGIALAKAAGKYKGRKPIEVDMEEFGQLHRQWKRDETQPKYIYKKLGLTRPTFYRKLYAYEKSLGLRDEDNNVIENQMEAYIERVSRDNK